MLYLVIKALISGAIIAVASEVSRRSPSLGALIVSLPLVSVLAMVWLWRDTGDTERLATHSQATFWYVLPSLPMLILTPDPASSRPALLACAGAVPRHDGVALSRSRRHPSPPWPSAMSRREGERG